MVNTQPFGPFRGAYSVIAPAGLAMRKTMWPVYRQAIEQNFSWHLSDREAQGLGEALARLLHAARGEAAAR